MEMIILKTDKLIHFHNFCNEISIQIIFQTEIYMLLIIANAVYNITMLI